MSPILKALRRRATFANTVSLLALFIALGGSSYAALKVTGRNVADSSLTGRDIRNGSLTGADVADGSLRARDLRPGELSKGAQGPQGPPGAQGPQGPAGLEATKLWAEIDGVRPERPTFVRHSGATAIQGPVAIGLTGVYRVIFDRDVSGCVPVASISTIDGGQPPSGQIGTTNSAANPNAIVVTTYDAAGTAVNTRNFTLAVLC